VQAVLALLGDLVDVDRVIVRAYSEVLLVGRVSEGLTPFSWLVESCNSLRPILVIQDGDISVVVADSQVVMLFRICHTSGLLMNWITTHSGCSRLDLLGLVTLAAIQLISPNFALSDQFLVFDAVLEDLIVISAGEEGSLVLKHLETPRLSIVVRIMNSLPVGAVDVDGLDSTVVVTDQDLTIQKIDG
jgi:hypothetical protein